MVERETPLEKLTLEVDGLACRRGGHWVFVGLSFTLSPGTALLVTGRNGAGKTTLITALAGFLRPDAGRLEWTGDSPDAHPRERIHHIGHLGAVKPALTLAENLEFWRDLYAGAGDVDAALAEAGLEGLAELPASVLSAGQSRRLALARLLVARRPVWLLDEPTTGLDQQGADWVARLLAAHLNSGGIAVIAAHQPLALQGNVTTLSLPMERPA